MVASHGVNGSLQRSTVNVNGVNFDACAVAEDISVLQVERGTWINGDITANGARGTATSRGQGQGTAVDEGIARKGIDRRQRQRTRTSLRQGSGVSAIIADDGTDCEARGAPLLNDEVVGARGIARSEYTSAADGDGVSTSHE